MFLGLFIPSSCRHANKTRAVLISLILMATKARTADVTLPQQASTSRAPAAETAGVTATVLQATALPASQFTALLAAIQDSERKLDGKLAEFKSDVRKAQEDATAKKRSPGPYRTNPTSAKRNRMTNRPASTVKFKMQSARPARPSTKQKTRQPLSAPS